MALDRPKYQTSLDAHQGEPGRSKDEIEEELRAMLRKQRDGDNDDTEDGVLGRIVRKIVKSATTIHLPDGDISDSWWGGDGDGGDGGGDGGGGGD